MFPTFMAFALLQFSRLQRVWEDWKTRTRPGQQYAVSRELRRRIRECFQKNNVQPGNPARVYVLEQPPDSPPA